MKMRTVDTFESAIDLAIKSLGGFELAAEITGKSVGYVRSWTDPDSGALPAIDRAVLLDIAALNAGKCHGPIFRVYEAKLKQAASPHEHQLAEPLDRMCDLVKECSEAVVAFREVIGPTQLARCKANAVLKELDDAERVIRRAKRDIEALVAPPTRLVPRQEPRVAG